MTDVLLYGNKKAPFQPMTEVDGLNGINLNRTGPARQPLCMDIP